MKIVVAGGGYGGLACLAELHKCVRDAELVLVDPHQQHLKITHLHESVRRPLDRFRVPYAQLARRFGFTHIRSHADLSDIERVAASGELPVAGGTERFDYLVIATGAKPPALPKCDGIFDRDDLCHTDTGILFDEFLADESRERVITVVGGGPTGIQFLFELADRADREPAPPAIRLVDREPALLQAYPPAIGAYVTQKLLAAGIEYLPATEYAGCQPGTLRLRDRDGSEQDVASGLTLMLPGVQPSPAIAVNRYGHLDNHPNVFAAGDCARYAARGDDVMTAQVAVRQGKLVALNIDRVSRGVRPLEYFFRELGYVVSLGPVDAVGWMLLKDQVVSGLPAFAIKEAVEAQYDLFVAGLDTYLV